MLKKKYDEKCDLWSCGVILYILLCGFPPFNGKGDQEILQAVIKGHFNFKYQEFDAVTPESKRLIQKMLEYDPAKRISAEEALNDPWFERVLGAEKTDVNLSQKVLTNLKTFRVKRIELKQSS